LKDVLDNEVRAKVQETFSEFSAKNKMELLRAMKDEIAEAVRQDISPFFKTRGISITTAGQFGGFSYENKAIQEAIDGTYIAQQEKVVNKAKLDAENDKNVRELQAAKNEAEMAKATAMGEAEAERTKILAKYEAEAEGIRKLNEALAGANPMVVQLKLLENEATRIGKWDGKFPVTYFGSGDGILQNTSMLLNLMPPAPEPQAVAK
jgi:hypothetical protein